MDKNRIITENSPGVLPRCTPYLLGMLICFVLVSCASRTPTEMQWQQEEGYRWADIKKTRSTANPEFNRVGPSESGINFLNHFLRKILLKTITT